jgi:transketolase C-terminal domain/subunit
MVVSEITMARLNDVNAIAHFSHAGVDHMADNTCHFGTSIFFADNGLPEGDRTRLYFPADPHQMKAVVEKIFNDEGLRFVFSTRSPVPFILDENGKRLFSDENRYRFTPGKDEIIREGTAGYVVSYGEMLYRALEAVEKLRAEGINVGLVNKPTLNVPDEDMMKILGNAPLVLLVESQNIKTGLGIRFGTWLLERGFCPKYAYLGSVRQGNGGIYEHMKHQGIDPDSIREKVLAMMKRFANTCDET